MLERIYDLFTKNDSLQFIDNESLAEYFKLLQGKLQVITNDLNAIKIEMKRRINQDIKILKNPDECCTPQCKEKVFCKGLCKCHYYDKYNKSKRKSKCMVNGCLLDSFCKGFCEIHYCKQLQGIVEGPVKGYENNTLKQCSIDGCTKKIYARGLCSTHYLRQRKVKGI